MGKLLFISHGVYLPSFSRKSKNLNELNHIQKCIHFWIIWWLLANVYTEPQNKHFFHSKSILMPFAFHLLLCWPLYCGISKSATSGLLSYSLDHIPLIPSKSLALGQIACLSIQLECVQTSQHLHPWPIFFPCSLFIHWLFLSTCVPCTGTLFLWNLQFILVG